VLLYVDSWGPRGGRNFDRSELAKMVQKQPDLLRKAMAARPSFRAQTLPRRKHFIKRDCHSQQAKQPIVFLDETGFTPSAC
jgi:hypothetical protein